MGQFRVEIEQLAKKHIEKHLKSGDKASIKKLEKIIEELSENPYECESRVENSTQISLIFTDKICNNYTNFQFFKLRSNKICVIRIVYE